MRKPLLSAYFVNDKTLVISGIFFPLFITFFLQIILHLQLPRDCFFFLYYYNSLRYTRVRKLILKLNVQIRLVNRVPCIVFTPAISAVTKDTKLPALFLADFFTKQKLKNNALKNGMACC